LEEETVVFFCLGYASKCMGLGFRTQTSTVQGARCFDRHQMFSEETGVSYIGLKIKPYFVFF
jgi:hypothetical protein